MSALPRYRVALMVSRHLMLNLEARNEQAAEDIATYLYNTCGDRHFEADPEQIIDTIIEGAA
jgi:hypothetical protein